MESEWGTWEEAREAERLCQIYLAPKLSRKQPLFLSIPDQHSWIIYLLQHIKQIYLCIASLENRVSIKLVDKLLTIDYFHTGVLFHTTKKINYELGLWTEGHRKRRKGEVSPHQALATEGKF